MHDLDPDPGRYGRSFAEVYDRWYPGGDEDAVVAVVAERLPGRGSVLELGVGTGRLALALVRAGFEVVGMDSSLEMLDRLAAKDPTGSVAVHRGDAGDPAQWPGGQFDAVLAACNLLVNLPSAARQRACVDAAAAALARGGHLFVEVALMAPPARPRDLEVRSVEPGRVVLIATEVDAGTGRVDANHVELVDGEAVRVRPWTVRILALEELAEWTASAGLVEVERRADWKGTPWTPGSGNLVVTYRRA